MPEKKYETQNEPICPECGSKKIEITEEDYTFTYGVGQEAINLTTRVPVYNCIGCGGKFLDAIADDICHEHVCRHLGVMTPSEIKEVRTKYNLSQAEFAEITKLGEATLSRWERGALIQNKAHDNYLYLLQLPINFERLRQRGIAPLKEQIAECSEEPFRVLKITPALKKRKEAFVLGCYQMAKES